MQFISWFFKWLANLLSNNFGALGDPEDSRHARLCVPPDYAHQSSWAAWGVENVVINGGSNPSEGLERKEVSTEEPNTLADCFYLHPSTYIRPGGVAGGLWNAPIGDILSNWAVDELCVKMQVDLIESSFFPLL